MVNDRLDAVKVCFDDERSVSGAGVLVVATLAQRLGLEALVGECVRLGRLGARFRPGRKVMSLVFAMLLGADSIDGCDVLRSGRTGRLLGVRVMAPSTLGTFLRKAFSFGHVRQLDRVLGLALGRAWRAGAGPGGERLVIDVDSFVGQVYGRLKQGTSRGYTHVLGFHPLLATRADTGEVCHIRFRTGKANTQPPRRDDRRGGAGVAGEAAGEREQPAAVRARASRGAVESSGRKMNLTYRNGGLRLRSAVRPTRTIGYPSDDGSLRRESRAGEGSQRGTGVDARGARQSGGCT